MGENSIGMNRALAFSYVRQLPRSSFEDIKKQEVVHDRQVLLNELWSTYCDRTSRPDWKPQEALRDKWIIETWEEWLVRKRKQQGNIESFFNEMAARKELEVKRETERDAKSEDVIRRIEEQEKARQSSLLPTLHTLLVDFEEMRLKSEAAVRLNLEQDETHNRQLIIESEDPSRTSLREQERDAFDSILSNIRDREAAEAVKLLEEENESNLEKARLAEQAALEADKLKQEEEAKLEVERRRQQEEKDRKVAERRARVMAEREKRKSKEELAQSRRDSRRRSSARVDSGIKDSRRLDSRNNRLARQAAELGPFLEKLKQRVSEVNSQEMIDKLLHDTAIDMGLLLFDTAVYFGICSPDGQDICYKYASSNCSEVLKAGEEVLSISGNPSCTTVSCIKDNKQKLLPNILKQNDVPVVRVGTKEDGGDGDFLTTPIIEASGSVVAVLSIDTVVGLNQRQDNLQDEEADCYEFDKQLPHIPITEEIEQFTSSVAAILSDAYVLGLTPNLSSSKQSISTLYSAATSCISRLTSPPLNCYIATLPRIGGDTFQVVSQNGRNIGENQPPPPTPETRNIVGHYLTDPSAPSFGMKPDVGSHLLIENVKNDDKVVNYQPDRKGGQDFPKNDEFLALFPIVSCNGLIGVVGVEGSSQRQLTNNTLGQIKKVIAQLSEYRNVLINFKMRKIYASQCVQWCAALSGCQHCYISIRRDLVNEQAPASDEGAYEYVSATASQQFVIGQILPPDTGITHSVIASGEAVHHNDVSKVPSVHFLKQSNSEGQLAITPIGTIGALYLDTVGWTDGKRDLTKPDLAMMETSASTLMKLFTQLDETGADAEDTSGTTLKIETEVNASCVRFLKKIWQETTDDLRSMKKEELLEMARYSKPPEAIPPVCSATFIIMGRKPKSVATWDQTRKCIKHTVIEKMTNFDPTKSTPAKAFFIRAKKLTKGCTVDFVAKKGSKPASLFFHWTFVNIQLRYASIYFKKLYADGMLEVAESPGPVEEKEEVPSEFGSSLGEAPTEDDEALSAGDEDDENAGEGGEEEAETPQ
eukprot:TRINITY_DN10683_c0_g1_i1.p1 TRINITY_DN10683_c0_g1~~TRINITY_DN10683_c0_g1_i1.p1  ORF type:complete len:1045 (+),score=217.09 TRINITY_DN10683_c0_g1_i1:134-3268(+)